MNTEKSEKSDWKAVYTIIDRGAGKKFWLRVGTAWAIKDNAWNVKLDAMPTNGQLQIREYQPPAERITRPSSLESFSAGELQ